MVFMRMIQIKQTGSMYHSFQISRLRLDITDDVSLMIHTNFSFKGREDAHLAGPFLIWMFMCFDSIQILIYFLSTVECTIAVGEEWDGAKQYVYGKIMQWVIAGEKHQDDT